MSPRDQFLELLARADKRVSCRGDGGAFQCPCHSDEHPSASFTVGENRSLVATCHGCGASLPAMLGALGATDEECAAVLERVVPQNDDATVYVYRDESGRDLTRVVRLRGKHFFQERLDATGQWRRGLKSARRVPYRLPETLAAIRQGEPVYITEGEKDADQLARLGLCSTCNPGGAGKWRADYTELLKAATKAVIMADNDEVGEEHAQAVAAEFRRAGCHDVRVVRFSGLPKHGDVSDWLANQGETLDQRKAALLSLVAGTRVCITTGDAAPPRETTGVKRANPWRAIQDAGEFFDHAERDIAFLEPRLLARGSLTILNSPRGIGKTHFAHSIAIRLNSQGARVLIVDRDNSRRELTRRLTAWGARRGAGLKLIGRDDAPALTDRAAWDQFPATDFDLVLIDSFDSSTEGVGDQDSGKPSLAMASLLDIVHTAAGPAVLVLGNTIKSGANGRGSGIIEDRADIVYEVRDATDLHPSGTKEWWMELPMADRGSWADRARRRKQRDTYRLALVPTKFRVGEEPDPFIVELVLTEPWTCFEVTQQVVESGERAEGDAAAAHASLVERMAAELAGKVSQGAASGTPLREREDAVRFLESGGLTRDEARRLIRERNGSNWRLVGPGHRGGPRILVPLERRPLDSPPAGIDAAVRALESRSPELPILAARSNQGQPDSCLAQAAPNGHPSTARSWPQHLGMGPHSAEVTDVRGASEAGGPGGIWS